jgi:hypothetical protein
MAAAAAAVLLYARHGVRVQTAGVRHLTYRTHHRIKTGDSSAGLGPARCYRVKDYRPFVGIRIVSSPGGSTDMEDADAIRGPWFPKRVVGWRKWEAVIGWFGELYQRASLIRISLDYGVRF